MAKAPQQPEEVGVRELRDHLSSYLSRVRGGREIVITERGTPIAKVVPVQELSRLDQLIAEGLVTPPKRPRPSKLPPPIPFEGDFGEFLRWAKGEDRTS